MSAPQPTPGPWRVCQYSTGAEISAGPPFPGVTPHVVAHVMSNRHDDPTGNANAALIARAPDLIAEVERLRAVIADVNAYFVALQEMRPDSQHGTEGERVRALVRAALNQ